MLKKTNKIKRWGLIPHLLNYFHFFLKKLLTRYLVFAITDIREGEMPSDINREELKMETIAKFEVGKTYTGPVYDVDGKRVDVVCIKRTAKYVTMARL